MSREYNYTEVVGGRKLTRADALTAVTGNAARGALGGNRQILNMTERQLINSSRGELSVAEARQLRLSAYTGLQFGEDRLDIPKA